MIKAPYASPRIIASIAMIFGMITATKAQENTVGTIAFDPSEFSPGYTLIYPHNQPHARLIDGCGEVVHIWENEADRFPGNNAMLTPSGGLVFAHRPEDDSDSPIIAGGRGETIEMRSWENIPLWSYSLNDSSGRLHHDFTFMNNGHVLAIAWETIDSLEAVEAGRNPENLEGGALWSERLIELQPDGNGGASVVWEWRAWDYLIQDFDSTKNNFGVIADHPERINVNFGTIGNNAPDWLHANGIDYNPQTNQILLSVPNFDELWIIDRGQEDLGLVWRWGNPEAYGQGTPEDQQLFYQHSGTWLDAPYLQNSPDFGKIGVFNNRNPGTSGPFSSVHIIDPTLQEGGLYAMENNTYLPVEFDWTWTAPVPTDFFSSGLSNFERLANGNNLILAGRQGEILELTAEGDTAWHYRVPLQSGMPVEQGTELGTNANILFKARRYPEQFPAFAGVELEPMGAWELNPQPVVNCLPCELEVSIEVVEDTYASANVSGASGETTAIWSLDDVNLCEGDTLVFFDEESPCQSNLDLLVLGDVVTLTVIDEQGCEASETFTWTAINQVDYTHRSPIRVFPNPSKGEINLAGLPLDASITILNAAGQSVWNQTTTGRSALSISLHHLPAGWYFLEADGKRTPFILLPH